MEKAFVFVTLESLNFEKNEQEVARKISEISGVEAVYETSGEEWDLIAQITVDQASKIGQIVMRQIKPISEVKTTRTILVLETFTKGG